jgi:hypothetical protein
MSTFKLASTLTALALLLASSPALAQTVCPEASEGQPCDGGVCVPATCSLATGDGGTTESACGLCIQSEPGQCLASGQGLQCPSGETCDMGYGGGGGSAGGGAGAGHPDAGTLTGFQYSVGTCVSPHEGDDGGETGSEDASALGAEDDAAAFGGGTENGGSGKGATHAEDGGVARSAARDAAAPGETAASTGGSSGGCSLVRGPTGGALWPSSLVGLGLVLARRRRGKSRRA